MSNELLIKPSDDIVFKKIFGEVGSENLIKDLLEAILGIQIESVELGREVELLPEKISEKIGILDVRVHLPDGTMVDVEMQNTNQKNITKRMTYYLSKLYAGGMEKGGQYNNLKKTIGIGILNFNYFTDIKEYHTKWKMTEQNNKEKTLEEQELHFIELPKFSKSKKDIKRKLDQWLAFIENSDRGLVEMAKKNNRTVKEAAKKYEYLTGDEAMQRMAFLKMKYEFDYNSSMADAREEGLEKGIKEGLEKGIKEGLEKGIKEGRARGKAEGRAEGRAEGASNTKQEIARKMLKKTIEIELIQEITGLSKEEIQKLKEEK